jgi:hypothetical protein
MASTKIEDLPDNLEENTLRGNTIPEELQDLLSEDQYNAVYDKKSVIPKSFSNYYSLIKDTLLVLAFLLLSTNNEIQKGIARFPLIKFQRSDIAFGVLVSVLFAILYAITKLFLL